jgi:aspartokinase-like uncharacterized kinase
MPQNNNRLINAFMRKGFTNITLLSPDYGKTANREYPHSWEIISDQYKGFIGHNLPSVFSALKTGCYDAFLCVR